ncbi:glycosyltransferase [candidate division WOR-3 bacterium]|uniref:Glycosyltransferase n=1 Tax=candidate division WOR-3 bacterium TaxID=2052148 RepID=A0A9D5K882_UNCW3|nr:glycosyltransferase [candidate division WOR-3 bacterium]MBD3363950.1 glycosyltransferase [candidate division WOR-3 bacterium]
MPSSKKKNSHHRLGDYAPIVTSGVIKEIEELARLLGSVKMVHVNSTKEGGGVAEILGWFIPILEDLGMKVTWDIITGDKDFFTVTKKFHNALHGMHEDFTEDMFRIYLDNVEANAPKIPEDADFVVIHDPQPAAMILQYPERRNKWAWRCHIDLSVADLRVWRFLRPFVECYDGAVFHMPQYTKNLMSPQFLLPPAIDPLAVKNEELTDEEISKIMVKLGIPQDKRIIVQIARFDRLKGPFGAIKAFRMVRRWHDARLILAGGSATDDPEGQAVLAEVMEMAEGDEDIHILNLPPDSHREINALQRVADVVIQNSTREGFGLTVTEAMWKGKPVVGTDIGGIRHQIMHGVSGFLTHSVEGLAYRIRQLFGNPGMARRFGTQAREYVRNNLLVPHHIRRWLLLFHSLHQSNGDVINL